MRSDECVRMCKTVVVIVVLMTKQQENSLSFALTIEREVETNPVHFFVVQKGGLFRFDDVQSVIFFSFSCARTQALEAIPVVFFLHTIERASRRRKGEMSQRTRVKEKKRDTR